MCYRCVVLFRPLRPPARRLLLAIFPRHYWPLPARQQRPAGDLLTLFLCPSVCLSVCLSFCGCVCLCLSTRLSVLGAFFLLSSCVIRFSCTFKRSPHKLCFGCKEGRRWCGLRVWVGGVTLDITQGCDLGECSKLT